MNYLSKSKKDWKCKYTINFNKIFYQNLNKIILKYKALGV